MDETLVSRTIFQEKIEQIYETLKKLSVEGRDGGDCDDMLISAATEVSPDGRFRYVRDAAVYFNVSEFTIRKWIKKGQLKASKPGKYLIVDVNSLNKKWKAETEV